MSTKKKLLEHKIKKALKSGFSPPEIKKALVELQFDVGLINDILQEISEEKELKEKSSIKIKRVKDKFVFDKIEGSLTYETKIDDFLDYINKKGIVEVKEMAEKFNISEDDIIKWVKILQYKHNIKIKYPLFGHIVIFSKDYKKGKMK